MAVMVVAILLTTPNGTVGVSSIDESSNGLDLNSPHCQRADNCQPRDVGGFRLFDRHRGADGAYYPTETSAVEAVLERGLSEAGASPTHLVLRGTADPDSVRCEAARI